MLLTAEPFYRPSSSLFLFLKCFMCVYKAWCCFSLFQIIQTFLHFTAILLRDFGTTRAAIIGVISSSVPKSYFSKSWYYLDDRFLAKQVGRWELFKDSSLVSKKKSRKQPFMFLGLEKKKPTQPLLLHRPALRHPDFPSNYHGWVDRIRLHLFLVGHCL